MPVFPLVGSSSSRPGSSSPDCSAASIIAFATRSLIEPVGFWPSSFANRRTSPSGFSSTSGVLPTRSSSDAATCGLTGTARHRRQEDHGVAVRNLRLVAVARANVLSADVDVRVLELAVQRREAGGEVVEELAHVLAVGDHLALAVRVDAERRRNADDAHRAAQNS